ncbi:Glutathione [Nesidiocoris tenuis]|uniref:Glutathione n=1 Tax=Nesidiocoris tenuis TaxID=355587 RepID=A0ABN7B604_9HEMI|nr:Glutathione [Nesidiocoris tenuis]
MALGLTSGGPHLRPEVNSSIIHLAKMKAELTYFDMSGLGEPVRVMLSYGNIPFDDIRLSKEKWADIKKETKFGQLPRLRIDGLELYQSRAICRYIATKIGLRSADAKEAALTDMWVDTFDDVRFMVVRWYYQEDSQERTENLENLKTKALTDVLSVFEKTLETENAEYFVNNKLSWADVMLFGYLFYIADLLHTSGEEILAKHSRLSKLYGEIKNSPGVQNWLKIRPQSPPDMRVLFS